MILGFKKQFVTKIVNNTKIHTLREDPHARWKENKLIHFATGVRTKKYNCFKKGVCYSVQSIRIEHYSEWYGKPGPFRKVYIDGDPIFDETMDNLATNDGFKNSEDFFKWFDSDFHGKIIHWTDFKY